MCQRSNINFVTACLCVFSTYVISGECQQQLIHKINRPTLLGLRVRADDVVCSMPEPINISIYTHTYTAAIHLVILWHSRKAARADPKMFPIPLYQTVHVCMRAAVCVRVRADGRVPQPARLSVQLSKSVFASVTTFDNDALNGEQYLMRTPVGTEKLLQI